MSLGVFDPDGQWVPGAWSASWDNNYELVDFTAPRTGQYRIGVYKERADEPSNYLGLAWVKDATYLPDVRGNYNGWNSVLRVRNDGAQGRNVTVTFFDRSGTPDPRSAWLNHSQLWAFNVADLIGSNFVGSAIVDGGEDVSDITVFNVGTSSTQVSVQYLPAAGGGTGCTATSQIVAPAGSYLFDLRSNPGCSLSAPFIGGARVTNTNGQPLVAIANQWKDGNGDGVAESFMTYEALPSGSTASFQPLLMRDNSTWLTGVSFQDTAGSSGNVTARYFAQDNGTQCGYTVYGLPANGITIANPLPSSGQCSSPFIGSGWSTRSNALAAVVNQVTTANLNGMSYSAAIDGSYTVVVPWVMKNKDDWQGRNDWYTGLSVQNLGGSLATVNVSYYNNDGSPLNWSEPSRQVPAEASHVYNPAPTTGSIGTFNGSAVVTANQPVAVVVNLMVSGSTDDTAMSYTGVSQ